LNLPSASRCEIFIPIVFEQLVTNTGSIKGAVWYLLANPAGKAMNHLLRIIKKSFLWSYARNTWQWDVLCVLILVFIFLSPKSWFVSGERHGPLGHQSEAFSTVIVAAELVDNDRDKSQLEQRVRTLTGQANARIIAVRPRHDSAGKTVAYEVDIR